jgi:glycosyltransferase involved in cell wall biosynthesis
MKKRLTHYIADNKIKVVPVWPASENFKPIEKKINPFLKKHKWTDKFILLYSGNMGYGHYLEPLIEVAQKVNQFKDIIFLFIGEGAKKTKLQDLVKDKGLCNVHFLTWQEHEILPYSLASGDIALVSQESETSYSSIPSKTFNYMAVGAPLIGIGKYGSDLQRIIEENNIGFYIDIDNFRDIEAIILNLYESRDSLTVLSRKSYETSKKYSHELSLDYLF